jgi:hypothetical protein
VNAAWQQVAPRAFRRVPDAIRRDPKFMHQLDMHDEWFGLCDRLDIYNGINRVYVDPAERLDSMHVIGD